MGINNTQTAYSFGQLGSLWLDDTGAATPPTDKVFVAITVVDDCAFTSLVADNNVRAGLEYIGTGTSAHDGNLVPNLGESGTGGEVVNSTDEFQAGLTIYGRWTSIQLASGKIIAYIGD